MRQLLDVAMVLAGLVVIVSILSAVFGGPSEGNWGAYVTMEGRVGTDLVSGTEGWECMGAGAYDALRPGATASLFDGDGVLLDVKAVTNGRIEEQSGDSATCEFVVPLIRTGPGHGSVELGGDYILTVEGHGVVAFVEDSSDEHMVLQGVVLE